MTDEHGQHSHPGGEPGIQGIQGERGPRGARGRDVQWRRVLGYLLLVFGGIVAWWRVEISIDQAEKALSAISKESAATDRTFCVVINNNRHELNAQKESVRKIIDLALRPQPIPSDPALKDYVTERNKRTASLRETLLWELRGSLPAISCDGIANGRIDFSKQVPSPLPGE